MENRICVKRDKKNCLIKIFKKKKKKRENKNKNWQCKITDFQICLHSYQRYKKKKIKKKN